MTGLGALILALLMLIILILGLAGMWAYLRFRKCSVVVSVNEVVVKVDTTIPREILLEGKDSKFESDIVNGVIDRVLKDEVMP